MTSLCHQFFCQCKNTKTEPSLDMQERRTSETLNDFRMRLKNIGSLRRETSTGIKEHNRSYLKNHQSFIVLSLDITPAKDIYIHRKPQSWAV